MSVKKCRKGVYGFVNLNRAGIDHMTDENPHTAGVIAPPPLIYAAGLALGLLGDRLLALPRLFEANAVAWGVVAVLALIGGACIAAALGRFGAAGTPAEPWKPTRALATGGVYRWTRNPMYLGMALLLLAAGVGFSSLGVIALFPLVILVIDRLVIAREERYLVELFGAEYAEYRSRVRRWF
jgi:protein-S-isoprenylcysteine O-methyltransferase Ste14